MSSNFELRLKKGNEYILVFWLSTTPCRELMSDHGLQYSEEWVSFDSYAVEAFENAKDYYKRAIDKYEKKVSEAKELIASAAHPQELLERLDEAKNMLTWAQETFAQWSAIYKNVEFALELEKENKDWELEYYSC